MRRSLPALVLTLLVLAACEKGPSPGERLEAAARATHAEGSAAVDLEMTTTVGPDTSGMEVRFSGQGAFDLGDGTGRLVVQVPALGDSMTFLRTADAAYVRTPGLMSGGRSGWVRKPVDTDADPAVGLGIGPGRLVEALEELEVQPRHVGTDVVRGTEVEGFELILPWARLRGDTAADPAAAAEMEVPTRVWVDGDDRVRRLEMEVDLRPLIEAARDRANARGAEGSGGLAAGMMAGLEGTMSVTLELFDFGLDVRAAAPDEAEVTDASELREPPEAADSAAGLEPVPDGP